MRPVRKGLCRYESLFDGSLSLTDIALMNDDLDCAADNEYLLNQYLKDHPDG